MKDMTANNAFCCIKYLFENHSDLIGRYKVEIDIVSLATKGFDIIVSKKVNFQLLFQDLVNGLTYDDYKKLYHNYSNILLDINEFNVLKTVQEKEVEL